MLHLQSVSCGYENFLLKNISITINTGDFVGIIGPNGSGKTTLLKAITRVISCKEGAIFLDGQNTQQMQFKELARKVAVVSQLSDTDLKIPVEDLILLGRIPHREGFRFMESKADLVAAQDAMVLTDVLRFRGRLVENLSTGERQLVSIARALAQEPKLLLLDEPTSHLDIHHQVKILDLIRRLNKENKLTAIIVLHDLNLAGQYCDRLILLKEGIIYKEGSPKNVLTYEAIEEVYETVVVVRENPLSSKPYIFLVPEYARRQS